MKYAHTITITEFLKPEEDIETAKQALKTLFPFDLEQEKISLKYETAQGFNEKPIKILTILLQKEKHTNKFIEFLQTKLSTEQKKLLRTQKESRTDNNLFFYIRIDKEKWNGNKEIFITESGNCIHIKISLAAFPAKKEVALQLVDKIFNL